MTKPPQLSIPFRDARHDAERVAKAVCLDCDTDPGEVLGRHQLRSKTELRMVVAYILRYHMDYSCCQIGKALGRDHSTIVHATMRAMDLMPLYREIRACYDRACGVLGITPHESLMSKERRKSPKARHVRKARPQGETIVPVFYNKEERRLKRGLAVTEYAYMFQGNEKTSFLNYDRDR